MKEGEGETLRQGYRLLVGGMARRCTQIGSLSEMADVVQDMASCNAGIHHVPGLVKVDNGEPMKSEAGGCHSTRAYCGDGSK